MKNRFYILYHFISKNAIVTINKVAIFIAFGAVRAFLQAAWQNLPLEFGVKFVYNGCVGKKEVKKKKREKTKKE